MSKDLSVHYSSNTPEWPTPQALFDALNREFDFTLDPCSTPENAKCARYFTEADNGLAQDWSGERVFMNPPYGRSIGHWVKKAAISALSGATVVCLLPARTDTKWWSCIWNFKANRPRKWSKSIRFIKGRVKFGDSKNSAPFPSVVVVLGA